MTAQSHDTTEPDVSPDPRVAEFAELEQAMRDAKMDVYSGRMPDGDARTFVLMGEHEDPEVWADLCAGIIEHVVCGFVLYGGADKMFQFMDRFMTKVEEKLEVMSASMREPFDE